MLRKFKRVFNFSDLANLLSHIDSQQKTKLVLLILLMLFSSIIDVISIGALIPFLTALTTPEILFEHKWLEPFVKIFSFNHPNQIVFPLVVLFVAINVFAGMMRIILLISKIRLSNSIGNRLSEKGYRNVLHDSYIAQVQKNSSETLTGITSSINRTIYFTMLPVLNIISSIVFFVSIISFLIFINPMITLWIFGSFGVVYLIMMLVSKKHLIRNSKLIKKQQRNIIKTIQESLSGIREVIIDNNQNFFSLRFSKSDKEFRCASATNSIIGAAPRFIIETLGVVSIALIALYLTKDGGNLIEHIPLLGVIALGFQRMLPIFQLAFQSWSEINGSKESLKDSLKLLNIKTNTPKSIPGALTFDEKIELKEVSFKYKLDSKTVIDNINLGVKKGEMIGVIGTTGSGKSTLIDILMGLLTPTIGGLFVDNVKITSDNTQGWMNKIAHVPQMIHLSDSSIAENIAFGIHKDEINLNKIYDAANKAELSLVVNSLSEGYNTLVGERGVRLSGGQCQRIGIARALYKQATILIFDEATSALDNETESEVMKAIEGLDNDLTIFIVAHRLTTLKKCDRIIKLDKGRIVDILSYKDIASLSGK
jgi:ATP-binding cassette, subfamily B, bacterial PglK